MRKILALALVASLSCVSAAHAVNLTYDAATGNLKFDNDLGESLAIVNIESPAGNISAPTNPLFTSDELPNYTTGFGVGTGITDIGNAYAPGLEEAAFRSDITVSYFIRFGGPTGTPQVFLTADQITYIPIPEPATVGLAGLGLCGLAIRRRRV